jgi:nitroreductase
LANIRLGYILGVGLICVLNNLLNEVSHFMDAIAALHQRVSTPRLTAPGPTPEQLNILFKAALRAADHGNMRPWRFLIVEGEGLTRLGELFARIAAAKNPDITQAELDRCHALPQRAPMIIVSIAKCQANPKVPQIEQIISAGAATQNLLNAAFAIDVGAVWRTGDMAYDPQVKQALGLLAGEEIIGFIYVGTPTVPPHAPREQNPSDFFSVWSQE